MAGYGDSLARQRFEETSRKVHELDEVHRLIMTGGDDWKPDNVKCPGVSDPTANVAIRNVDELEEYLTELRKQEQELVYYIGVTLQLIAAVKDGLGRVYADVLEQRYIDCRKWRDVVIDGDVVPRSTGNVIVNIAFDWIDSISISALLRGETEL